MHLTENLKRASSAGVVLKNSTLRKGLDSPIWSADVYLSGRKLGTVVNEGNGIVTDIVEGDVAAAVAALKAADYVLQDPADNSKLPAPLNDFGYFEQALENLGDELDALKSLKAKIKKNTLFDLNNGMRYTVKMPFSEALAVDIRKTHGDRLVCIINEELAAL